MAYMVDIGRGLSTSSGRLSPGTWLAVCFLRRLAHPAHCSLASNGEVLESSVELACAEEAFRFFLVAAQQNKGAREPHFAHPNSPLLTKDEQRLLRALAAAQAGDEVLLDNYLYKLALHPLTRAQLAQAMRVLASALAAQGHDAPLRETRQLKVSPNAFGARDQGQEQFNVPAARP